MSRVWGWPWGSSETSLPRLVQNSYFSHASSCRENVASARRVVQNKPSPLIHREENKVESLARQFLSEKLSFVHKKESEHSFDFLFPLVSFIGVFSIVKCKTFVLLTDDIYLGVKSACFFPTPDVVAHLAFLREEGIVDLVWERIFSPTLWS